MKLVKLPLANDKLILLNPKMVMTVMPVADNRTMVYMATSNGPLGYDVPLPYHEVERELARFDYTNHESSVRFEILTRVISDLRKPLVNLLLSITIILFGILIIQALHIR